MTGKRTTGDFEIIHSLHIGAREVIVGDDERGHYMCCYCTTDCFSTNYTDYVVSDDYLEIMEVFIERIRGQVDTAISERKTVHVPLTPILQEQCFALFEDYHIINKVVAVRLGSLRYEHRRADRQLILVEAGHSAQGNARGTGVFGRNLYTGRRCGRWERQDIQGVVRPEELPDWAKDRLKVIQREQTLEKKPGGKAR